MMQTAQTQTVNEVQTTELFGKIVINKKTEVNGGFRFIFRIYDINNQDFVMASAYARYDQEKLINYYSNKKKGDLVSCQVVYRDYDGQTYINIWSMFDRHLRK